MSYPEKYEKTLGSVKVSGIFTEVHFGEGASRRVMREVASLGELARARGVWVGAAVEPRLLREEPAYRERVEREFNALVAENCMKFSHLQPERGVFTFDEADRLLDFAEAHQMAVRGHTLAWHRAVPPWLAEGRFCRSEAMDLLHEHIATVAGHFRKRVFCWDVVNEAIEDRYLGYRDKNIWYRTIGEDYLELAFRWAHEADPDALLFYNDYDLQAPGGKFERAVALVRGLQRRGAPIHGFGFQFHTTPQDSPGKAEFLARLVRVREELGLVAHITEMDINLPAQSGPGDFEQQAAVYRSILEAALESRNCPALLVWGVSDKHTWVRDFTQGKWDHPLLFDASYQPKPAYFALCEALQDTPSSR